MSRSARAVAWLTGASLLLGCDRGTAGGAGADAPATIEAPVVVTTPERRGAAAAPGAAVAPAGDGQIQGPTAEGVITGMETSEDPILTLFDPEAPRVVTLALVAPAARRKAAPSMDLFGGADRPWRVQVGPRTDLGRESGLMLRGGTQGQHNRWDIDASATVGDRSNVQGIVRYHP